MNEKLLALLLIITTALYFVSEEALTYIASFLVFAFLIYAINLYHAVASSVATATKGLTTKRL